MRNFFWLYRRDVLDANGNVCDYDDDMRNEVKIKQAWVYDYLDLHKENLERLWITEDHMKNYSPMLTLSKQEALNLERLKMSPDFQLYQKIVENLKSEEENLAFLNPSQTYEHLVARNVYESVLTINDKLIEDTRERIRIEETSATASY